jgi:hypothetical protein
VNEAVSAAASLAHSLGVLDALFALRVVAVSDPASGGLSPATETYIHSAFPATFRYVGLGGSDQHMFIMRRQPFDSSI